MGKKKTATTQQQSQNINYGYMNTPITSEMQAVLDIAKKPIQVDPSIMGRYATMEEDVRRSYADPFGAATSPDVRAKAQRGQLLGIQKERDKAMREGYFQSEQAGFGRKMSAAALTMPQMVTTGSTGQGTQTTEQSGGFWRDMALGVASGAASGAAA